jgi:pimeloyl-ACP methyl ester carboxylesterase
VLREADAHGWERFHLLGYSGGGAASLAFAAARQERLASLAVLEPAWAGNWDLSPAEKALWLEYDRLEGLPAEQFMPTFMRFGLKPGVPLPPPPPGDPPPWMAKRPAGIRAIRRAFKRGEIDREGPPPFRSPCLLRARSSQQPGPVRGDRETSERSVPRLRARGVRGAPPLRPAAPDRAGAPCELAQGTLAACRTVTALQVVGVEDSRTNRRADCAVTPMVRSSFTDSNPRREGTCTSEAELFCLSSSSCS